MRKFVVLLGFIVGLSGQGYCSIRSALSANYADVAAAVNAALPGDVVQIPAGDVTWTTGSITVSKRIQIVGAGQDVTTIHRGTNTSRLFYFNSTILDSSTVFGLAYMTIDCSGSEGNDMVGIGAGFNYACRYFRFHDLKFINIAKRGMETIGTSEGVIDHCYFRAPYNLNAQGITVLGSQRAGSDVTNSAKSKMSVQLGVQKDFLYIEDCVFDFAYDNDAATELYYDAHAVFRHNTVTNSSLGVHEMGLIRTATVWEYYNNLLYSTYNGPAGLNEGTVNWLVIRSGWGVVYNNTIIHEGSQGIDSVIRLLQYRASGTNVYSLSNPAAYVSLCSSGPYAGTYSCGIGVTGINRLDGNSNSVCIGYPAFDQPGWGDPTTWYPDHGAMTFHGCYSWSNLYTGKLTGPLGSAFVTSASTGFGPKDFSNGGTQNKGLLALDHARWLPTTADLVKSGRDYFNDTVKPDYKPLIYPHPLVSGAVTVPPPPVNLRVVGGN